MTIRFLKPALLLLIFLLCISQYVQKKITLVEMKPLKGAFTIQEKPDFSWKTFWTGEFQTQFTNYIEHHNSFRPFLIRLKNQLDYSLFSITSTYNVIIGKNEFLFEENYIKDYTGNFFIGNSLAEERLCKLKFIQDELKKRGIDLIIGLSPGKASFYPEYIPDKYMNDRKTPSNYSYYRDKGTAIGLNIIDFNQYLINMKDTCTWPVYPKTGIHWSVYGMGYCVDSLMNYIGKMRNVEMVDFGWDGVDVSMDHRDTDDDIWDGMNLLIKFDDVPMAYPRFYFKENANTRKPSLMCISDSFYWNVFGAGISGRLFNGNDFWFYYVDIHDGKGGNTNVKNLDVKKEFESHEVILMMATEATLDRFPYGFIEDAYRIYFPQDAEGRKQLFSSMIQCDTTWSNVLAKKAKTAGITLEQARQKELEEAVNYDTALVYSEQSIQTLIQGIRSNKEWYEQEVIKAKEKGITIDELLRMEALWMIKNGEKSPIQRYWPINWR